MKINIKTPQEIETMKEGGKILTEIMRVLWKMATPGVTTLEMNEKAEELMKKYETKASFKTVNHYQYAICACPDDVVVHGLPNKILLTEGQILGIDCGVLYRGLHTDAAFTKILQKSIRQLADKNQSQNLKLKTDKFLKTGRRALEKAIQQCVVGNRVWDISNAIQETIEEAGYNVVQELTGHGVGRKLHEQPDIYGLVMKPREKTEELLSGMTLAVEIIYTAGNSKIVYKNKDGWTIATKDGSLAGLFEETIVITDNEPLRITPIMLQFSS